MGLASLFAVPGAPIRSIFLSNGLPGTARGVAKTLDQGLGAVHFRKPGLNIAEPGIVGLAGYFAQSLFGILQFPK